MYSTVETHPIGTKPSLPQIIGNSPKMARVFDLIYKVAGCRSPVLILGETGTGKGLVARAIHAVGPGRHQPFVAVDLPSLAPTLLESELFGHIQGAFTGAMIRKKGLLETAGKGTLLLDEIADMPIDLQTRLLHVIQEKEFKPVGATWRVPLKARILAATNHDLVAAVRDGVFRKDLYFRLNVLSITLPPLRERRADIPLLAQSILGMLFLSRNTNGHPCPYVLSSEALDCLMEYDWPGNVRELENCLERAVTLSSGPVIRIEDLALNKELAHVPRDHIPFLLKELEHDAILRALAATCGKKPNAARLLGIGKSTLYRKLRTYGLLE